MIADEFLMNFLEKQGTPGAGWFCEVVGGMATLSQPGPHATPRIAVEAKMKSLKGS